MTEANANNFPIKYAGFWIRALAHVIDSIIVTALLIPVLFAVYRNLFNELAKSPDANPFSSLLALDRELSSPLGYALQYGLPAIAIILLWKAKAATPGKMMLHTKIVDAGGSDKLGTGQCLIRYVGYAIPMVPFLFFMWAAAISSFICLILGALTLPLTLCFFWIMWDKRKQGWHDKLARTVVIRTR